MSFDTQDRQRKQREVEQLLLGRTIKSVEVSKCGTVELLTDTCERVYLESGSGVSLIDYTNPVVVRSLGKVKPKVTNQHSKSDKSKVVVSIGRWRMNDFATYKGERVRIVALYKNPKRAWVSNLNMPFCGSISQVVPLNLLSR